MRTKFVAQDTFGGLPLYRWRNGPGSPLVAVFVHPSTRTEEHAWESPVRPYFRGTVIPTIAAVHQSLGIQ